MPFTVYPSDAVVHIGLSYNPYSLLNDPSDVEQMSNCTSLPGPLAQGVDLERQCQPGVSGRYIYVFIEGKIGNSQLDIWELQMYGSMYVHSVNTISETYACRTTQPSAHQILQQHRFCLKILPFVPQMIYWIFMESFDLINKCNTTKTEWPYWWLSTRLQYLQCVSNEDTAVFHKAIDICTLQTEYFCPRW